MGFFNKIAEGLKKTRDKFFGNIKTLFAGRKLDDEVLEELEEIMILSDMGVEATEDILKELKERYKKENSDDPLLLLRDIMVEHLKDEPLSFNPDKKPFVILVVGVNGTGKTTTIAKLGKLYKDKGHDVVFAAGDTFRAAAIEQLKEWGNRLGIDVIAHTHGADAAAVAFDALNHAVAKGRDIVIIDTAGRLHTKQNLMEELKKIKRVIQKVIPDAPHETLLVLDGTTGQNGIIQAKVFKETTDLTGIVVTKLDGTAKGGIAFAINQELDIPIKLIGVGEKADDLQIFDPKTYCNALLGIEEK
ncbi:cell division protein FtsY [Marinitoga sp. 1135]|uniref:Signal recognition particle receptor FtsY n=1 Tax=Marinitoga piezophila (strain DSM 14283 / JCM 11233 / KA3) TaxID=443254 RepID=H2J604_MARPK|nr:MULTISPECIES: signal recognition particle-docking protein FtsY [Marinitoga]AEX86223.1 signal recognition particle-docking protein FtsY [Marinitoga piezophila KA3]APT76635.1 cell division protein FtsY [Marinitoga sp. 1137]NUU96410.1 cell division protein FtsY [Marinitoga sp. 1135]NUU98331.1 cell division protein FtsY [Marinitoga sp. 1138]